VALTSATRLRIEDPSAVAHARRTADGIAERLGFDEHGRGEIAIVVTELCTNVIRHADRGEIVLRPIAAEEPTLDVVAWDRGPGIADVAKARRDGFSTRSGSGTGLGAIERISASFELQTRPGQGTVAAARVGGEELSSEIDGLVLPLAGEEMSGDVWAYAREGDVVTVVLADGLGHGPEAARAGSAAARQLRNGTDPVELLERMHGALRATRGAAVAVARVDLGTGALRFAGVGNIAAVIVSGTETKTLPSMNGTIGHRVAKIRADDLQLAPGAQLIMHSDGCRGGWELSAYPGLLRRAPLLLASVLLRDFERGRDDVSVVVTRVRADRDE
jgi:anti-sigma regulatory factor (Ser/Thr protein kinase)